MTKHYAFQAEKRDGAGKGAARAIRRDNKIPAVIYGGKKEPVKITLPMKEANVEYNKGHMFTTLCDLDIAGEKHLVLARDIQLHPVSDRIEHIDFLRVTEKTKIAVSVPVEIVGYEGSPAEKEKGVLNITRHEVEIISQAQAIPETLEVDASKAEIGGALKSSDALLPAGSKFVIDDRDFTIATISAPRRLLDEDEPAADGEGGE